MEFTCRKEGALAEMKMVMDSYTFLPLDVGVPVPSPQTRAHSETALLRRESWELSLCQFLSPGLNQAASFPRLLECSPWEC